MGWQLGSRWRHLRLRHRGRGDRRARRADDEVQGYRHSRERRR